MRTLVMLALAVLATGGPARADDKPPSLGLPRFEDVATVDMEVVEGRNPDCTTITWAAHLDLGHRTWTNSDAERCEQKKPSKSAHGRMSKADQSRIADAYMMFFTLVPQRCEKDKYPVYVVWVTGKDGKLVEVVQENCDPAKRVAGFFSAVREMIPYRPE